MKAVILAGGAGTRLRSMVPDLPKPMARVAGRPFLEFVIERLVRGGITDLVLSVGYRADVIRGHFGSAWGGATLSYANEPEPLGTGGAVARAVRGWPDAPLLVVNGDSYQDIDYADFARWAHADHDGTTGMVVCHVADVSRYGAVICAEGVVQGFAEKGAAGPGLINGGVYLIRPSVFARFGLSGRFSLESDLFQPHIGALRPRAYVTDGFFIDIGTPGDFMRAQTSILQIARTGQDRQA